MELLEVLTRIAELERKLDSMFRHGPVHDREKIDGRWFVRLKIGGNDQAPFLSPWMPYSSANGGPEGLNMHRVPTKGEQLTMLSPAGDFRQAVAVPLFWSDDHPAPSDDEDALTITHPKFRLDLKDGALKIETKGALSIACQTFSLKGHDGSGISMVDGKLTLKADVIETDGETRLDKGSKQVHRIQDHDSHGDVAIEGAPRVYA
jgi:phage baseplate assembly protein gpV